MKIGKKTIVTVVTLIGVVALGIKGKGLLEKRREQVANEPVAAVEKLTMPVVYAKEGTLAQKEGFLAQLLAQRSIKLSTKLAGYVEKLYVEEAQAVQKGDPLVKIDATEIKSNIEALGSTLAAQKNDLAVARSIYNRNKKLYDVGGLPKEKLDLSLAALNAKASMVENTKQKIVQLKHQLSYLKIVAPFDGIVDTVMLHEGDLAATGKPILSMSSLSQKLVFSFAPALEGKIKKGDPVFWNNEYVGDIKTIYNTAVNGLSSAEVALEKDIHQAIGSNLNIEVQTNKMQGCVVPADTLLHKKEGVFVMAYENGRFTPQPVSVKMEVENSAVIVPCTTKPLAKGTEVKLSSLPAYEHVEITGAK